MSYDTLDSQVFELRLYAVNFSDYHYNNTEKVLASHWLKAGGGEPSKGWEYIRAKEYCKRYLIDPAAKDYKRENGSMTQRWSDMWPLLVRRAAAEEVLEGWIAEWKLGNVPS